MNLEGLDLLMDLISKAKYIVALTGAGISTNAGIPDFRSPKGFYSQPEIPGEEVFDIGYFKKDPSLFYKHIGVFLEGFMKAEPTKGHLFLKKLEDLGKLKCIITQNVDGLHEKAGNSYVIDVHGNFRNFFCMDCKTSVPLNEKILSEVKKKNVPKCKSCSGVLKPEVVFFGEPVHALEKALTEVQKADLLITLGTSLRVYPVAQLPSYIDKDAKLVIINREETPYDNRARLVIYDDIDTVAQKLGLL
jgi:NAD-dependent deacetylase